MRSSRRVRWVYSKDRTDVEGLRFFEPPPETLTTEGIETDLGRDNYRDRCEEVLRMLQEMVMEDTGRLLNEHIADILWEGG